MPRRGLALFFAAFLVGFLSGHKNLIHGFFLPADAQSSNRYIRPWIRARQLTILDRSARPSIIMGSTSDGNGLWMNDAKKLASLQMGVHSNGFPFLLVSDGAIRNFGLGRVDGKNASPVLVLRSNDQVKSVFGLSMTEAGQPPFWVHYSANGTKTDYIGRYCNNPNRECAH